MNGGNLPRGASQTQDGAGRYHGVTSSTGR